MELVAAAEYLHQNRLTHGATGNISARDGDTFMISPTGKSLDVLEESDFARMDFFGNVLSQAQPSKEYLIHQKIYQARPDIHAIVHTHSTFATALSCLADIDLDDAVLPLTAYFSLTFAPVPIVPYYPPGDERLALGAAQVIERSPVLILRNHGPVVGAANLRSAVDKLEELEHAAQVNLLVRNQAYVTTKAAK